ncbi:MAG: M67 family metallopeptidase [Sphingomonas sp.]|uniref:M67 family metallopeptidase n=1 Tax=Sphingomonas sp. TaxID=28214 RepID=UPI0035631FC5
MGYGISSTLLGRLLTDAKNSPEAEVCGLLFGTEGRIETAEACANVAAEPARAFEIDPAALFAAYRRMRGGGPRPIGHYHSHPSGEAVPSARDAAQAMGDGALWLILTAHEARLWRTDRVGTFEAVALQAQEE